MGVVRGVVYQLGVVPETGSKKLMPKVFRVQNQFETIACSAAL